ncbi:EEF1A lysine methyltransferase 3 isoform X2 [Juglans microcarpa x Juglans regia]|uniref:EEF1A lysine methyltransferase 3 isoform X2 n=1 Tax=Juglans microcarpa x Juglans regia TaxID=2249226 RepID=UPI001B7E84BA|nr:EEF1A lysine methyltransferase 3 isoform X2 [Juglans microcarpa x Juglans regia]
MATAEEAKMEGEVVMVSMGSYGGKVKLLSVGEESAAEETMLLWGIQQPTFSKPNAFVSQSSLQLSLDACGQSISILQSPSSLSTPGVTGAVMWDSGIVLAKFLEHSVDSRMLLLKGKNIVELGSGCGLGSATVRELVWGDDPDRDLIEPHPDYVLGSDVIYSEEAVTDLVATLLELCGSKTTIFLAGELRNDAILEYFLEVAMKNFIIGRVDQTQWHPEYCSSRVVLYILVKK